MSKKRRLPTEIAEPKLSARRLRSSAHVTGQPINDFGAPIAEQPEVLSVVLDLPEQEVSQQIDKDNGRADPTTEPIRRGRGRPTKAKGLTHVQKQAVTPSQSGEDDLLENSGGRNQDQPNVVDGPVQSREAIASEHTKAQLARSDEDDSSSVFSTEPEIPIASDKRCDLQPPTQGIDLLDDGTLEVCEQIYSASRDAQNAAIDAGPSVKTTLFKHMIAKIKEVDECYLKLADIVDQVDNNPQEEIRRQLKDLTSCVSTVFDHDQATSDMYTFGIPFLIRLLKHALKSRSTLYSKPEDVAYIPEIIQILDITLAFSPKVGEGSKATSTRIRKIFNSRFSSRLRQIRNVFQGELGSRTERSNYRFHLQEMQKVREQYKARMRRVEEDWEKDIQARRWATQQSVLLEHSLCFPHEVSRHTQAVPANGTVNNTAVNEIGNALQNERRMERLHRDSGSNRVDRSYQAGVVEWGDEEIKRLIRLLSKFSSQPIEERYVSCLTDPLFQNRLPEYIRSQALKLKDSIRHGFQASGLAVPEWADSIA